jgi:hypothetical protein
MATTTKIEIGINDEVIELTGEDKAAFIAQRELDAAEVAAMEAERNAKTAARASALAKLADLGLTEEEVAAL